MHRLRIELKSAACPAAGVGRAGHVDREVSLDSRGLPWLAGRRLKGLLRDAYEQVAEAAGLPDGRSAALFGRIGDRVSGAIRIGNGRLAGAHAVGVWLRDASRVLPELLDRNAVIAHYTEIRRQTRIDRESEAPQEDTLRATRVLRSGLVFYAPVEGLTEETAPLVALAAAAVQSIGSSRTRGLGYVETRLESADSLDAQKGTDLSTGPIEALETGHLHKELKKPAMPVTVDDRGTSPQKIHTPDCLMRYRITLREPAMIPRLSGDPNLVNTHQFIPGSTIQGVFAARYLAGRIHTGRSFEELITGGAVLFLGAHLSVSRGGSGDAKDVRSVLIPHSVRQEKNVEDRYIDLATWKSDNPPPPLRRKAGWTLLNELRAGQSTAEAVKTSIQYHHARPDDRRVGHVVGVEQRAGYGLDAEKSGAFFSYESLVPDQTFIGAVLGSEEDLKALRKLIPDAPLQTIRIGRARNSQYGGDAEWKWLDAEPLDSASGGGEAAGWADRDGWSEEPESSARLIVTLLSPLLARNEHGHPVARLPLEELQDALGTSVEIDADAKAGAEFTRVARYGGYLSHQRLQRQQLPALDGGSVFVLNTGEAVSPQRMRDAERRSYGMRTAEGFGRISIHTESHEPNLKKPKRETPDYARVTPGTPEWRLAEQLMRQQLQERMASAGLERGRPVETEGLGAITSNLLHTLAAVVRTIPLEHVAGEIDRMRENATRQMERCVVRPDDALPAPRGGKLSLKEFLIHTIKGGNELFVAIAKRLYGDGWIRVFEENPLCRGNGATDPAFAAETVRLYLLRYLDTLAWRKRQAPVSKGGN